MEYTKENTYRVLRAFNPWWSNGTVNEIFAKGYHRFGYYDAMERLRDTEMKRAVVLLGARRVGKTTIQYQMIDTLLKSGIAPNRIVFFSLDHPILKVAGLSEILELYHENVCAAQDCYYFLDEIQHEKGWENWIKSLHDMQPETRIIATGSASAALNKGASESGVGRFANLKIPTLSFYEYCSLLGINKGISLPTDLRPTSLLSMTRQQQSEVILKISAVQNHLNRYLLIGGFPELAVASNDLRASKTIREDIIDKVLKRDIPEIYEIRNLADLERIFLYICNITSDIVSIESMCKELNGVSRPTAENYLRYLESANLIYISKPVSLGNRTVLKSSPKIYIADSAIRSAVLMDDAVTDPTEMGKIAETTVYKHVYSFFEKQSATVGYYRGGDRNKEIDIVVSTLNGKKFLIEAKYRNQAKLTDNSELAALAADADAAFVMTKRIDDYGIQTTSGGTPILRIPTSVLLYLIGHCEKNGSELF
ncbi:MAG: ATP-binding protein [Clostridiales bacterium]|jgi:predicted AAA+ superfamily ATPase|nr:ATP-binding protein [Clostridiales bacterium]